MRIRHVLCAALALSTVAASAALAAPTARPAARPALAGWSTTAPSVLWPVGTHRAEAPGTPTYPDSSTYNNLIYHGGSVMHRPHVYLVFWGTEWKAGFRTGPRNAYSQKTAMTYVSTFFANVGGSKWHGVQSQFCDGIGAGAVTCAGDAAAKYVQNRSKLLSGIWVDPTPVPATITTYGLAENVVTDPVATEAVAASKHFRTTDPDALFMVWTPPGHQATAYGSVYCAYHSQVTDPTGVGIRYAFMPYTPEQGAGCGGNSVNKANDAFGHGYLDSYSLAGGHEFEEAVTDPDNTLGVQDGWNDYQTSENGDKCAYFHAADLRFGKYTFAVQPMWSNEANGGKGGCAMARGTGAWPVPAPV